MKTRTKVLISIIAVALSALLVTTIVLLSYGDGIRTANIRNMVLENKGIDVESTLRAFDNPSYQKIGNTVYFEGSKKFDLKQISNIENLSEKDKEKVKDGNIKFKYTYDVNSNVILLKATAEFADGRLEVEELRGVGFVNDNKEIDAVMNVDGEGVLLSEMRASGMIENCGWFSRLIRRVVSVAVATVAVVAVGALTVGLAVATAGVVAPALMAAGIGLSTTMASGIGAIAGGVAGKIFLNTIGKSLIESGVAFAEAVGEGVEQVVDKVTKEVRIIIVNGIEYALVLATTAILETLKHGGYRIVRINKGEAFIRVSEKAIPFSVAVDIIRNTANLEIKDYAYSIYNFSYLRAFEVAQAAGGGAIPEYHDIHEPRINPQTGRPERGSYYQHFHINGFPKRCGHAFFGLPKIYF